MPDLFHLMGGDLALNARNGLLLVTGPALTRQRLYRRLLTNPGAYIFHPEYGAGLGRFVGDPAEPSNIEAVIRAQVRMEDTVARNPAPTITVQVQDTGFVSVTIGYSDEETGQPDALSFTVTGAASVVVH